MVQPQRPTSMGVTTLGEPFISPNNTRYNEEVTESNAQLTYLSET